jgi:tetratricopeptide (TPR) repeat protein
MQVAAGTIPDGYKWLSSLMGIKGSIKNGMTRLEKFFSATDEWASLFRDEAIFYYCYLKFYIQNDKEGVFNFIQSQKLDVVNNHLFTYLAANLGLNNQMAESAQKIILGRNTSPAYFVTPIWDMELGYAKLFHLEPDAAFFLDRFVNTFKGKFYVKDVLQKLSWHYYLMGDKEKALFYRQKILQRGSTDTEADKQAQKEAGTTTWPNPLLLRARLLNDGGYHREALRLLHGKNANDFAPVEEKLEFAYRAGRLYDDLHADDQAMLFYKDAIALGEKRKEYFAARAALQIGFIYEKKGDKVSAAEWFRRCISMKDHDFKNSLDQRAKAGLARCEN